MVISKERTNGVSESLFRVEILIEKIKVNFYMIWSMWGEAKTEEGRIKNLMRRYMRLKEKVGEFKMKKAEWGGKKEILELEMNGEEH